MKTHMTLLTLSMLAMGMMTACGQRSELIDCDGEVELRGNQRICLDDVVEPVDEPTPQPEVEPQPKVDPDPTPEPQPKPQPEPQPEPSPVQPQPEPQPEPTPEPQPGEPVKSYATDDRGFPVARHTGSFRQIVHSPRRSCVIDEFADLYCWDIDLDDDLGGMQRPSRIEPLYEGVAQVVLSDESTCVLQSERHYVDCLDAQGQWHNVFGSRSRFEQLSMDDYGNHVCVVDEYGGSVYCASLYVGASEGEEFFSRGAWFEPDYRDTYASFDLADLDLSRGEYFAALSADGVIEYYDGSGSMWYGTRVIANAITNSPFVDVHQTFGSIAALTEDGSVQLYFADTNDSSSLVYSASLEETFVELYSPYCGLSEGGQVLCWNYYTRAVELASGIDQDPVAVSIRDAYTYCAIAQDGKIDCGLL